jgi:hypothetical protein
MVSFVTVLKKYALAVEAFFVSQNHLVQNAVGLVTFVIVPQQVSIQAWA